MKGLVILSLCVLLELIDCYLFDGKCHRLYRYLKSFHHCQRNCFCGTFVCRVSDFIIGTSLAIAELFAKGGCQRLSNRRPKLKRSRRDEKSNRERAQKGSSIANPNGKAPLCTQLPRSHFLTSSYQTGHPKTLHNRW